MKHEKGKDKLRNYLKEAPSAAITTDTWTSCSDESHLTITAHFIINQKLIACVLQTRAMEEKQSAEQLGEKLVTEVVNDWDWGKVRFVQLYMTMLGT